MISSNREVERLTTTQFFAQSFAWVKSRISADISLIRGIWRLRRKPASFSGQGTTEYAILVGVLVVIAILAITVFRPKIQELWDAISSGINGL